ncbi:MAG: hypothetical protein ACLQVI_31050 [Polyangiaceae bacterium]
MKRLLSASAVALALLTSVEARAVDAAQSAAPADDETATIFAAGIKALGDGRPGDAVADFEALGDRGVVDAVVSYDRGLAYGDRVRGRGALPGDLGRAALGFEEARALTRDPALARDATKALGQVRAEVARRRALAGEPVEVDPGVSLGRAIVALAPEDAWGVVSVVASLLLTASLFVRWLSVARRVRIGAAIAIAVAAPALAGGALLVLAARDERLHLREGVIVSESARLSDERHITLPGAAPLPEAARVTVEEAGNGWARVRFGAQRGFVPSPAVRPLARPD